MTNSERARSRARVVAVLFAAAVVSLSCDDNEHSPTVNAVAVSPVISRHVVGVAEVTFSNATSADISSRILLASSVATLEQLRAAGDTTGDVSTVSFEVVATGEFAFTPPDTAGVRFIRATFGLRNTSATPLFDPARENLSLVAVGTSNTLAGTPVRLFQRADGSPADVAIAQQLAATNLLALDADGMIEVATPTILQTLTDSQRKATELPTGASKLFPFAFVVRSPTDFVDVVDAVPPFDGLVTVALRLPKQPSAQDDPTTISLFFLLVNDANATRAP